MDKYYKVQQYRERFGFKDISDWVSCYHEAENMALTMDKPKTEHIRILEKTQTGEHSASFRSLFIRGAITEGIDREVR